ncbi:unnamed protein product [Cyclocybe aegerita]|uniref:Arrestin C-terminal-like domain-containing protein n=1 Tax=Cyclocybe aegerita TaxID=1973307 RepID=A0A8S0X3E1_CYCAE|nr:unnamed protein product [Cyclocybe aegerita]
MNLVRQGTILGSGSAQGADTDFGTVLGDAHSRLKSGAKLQQSQKCGTTKAINLERASPRSRVDVDILLESDVCVEGGQLTGRLKIRVRKQAKGRDPVMLSEGKVRIIGFESTMNAQERSIFYERSAPLGQVSSGLTKLYTSEFDDEGFAQTSEGVYTFPLAVYLCPVSERGAPKGNISVHPGVAVRYIAMVSLRIKDPLTGSKAVTHFYRDCSIWPRLNPSVVLAPLLQPLQATASESGGDKVQLTASLHRSYWVAGQLCHVRIRVVNNSKKVLKSVVLELFRSTTIFRRERPASGPEEIMSVSPASTTTKKIAEASIVMGDRATRGHASAKGWWTGVAPGEMQVFMHSILIPVGAQNYHSCQFQHFPQPDAVSISRGQLLEISYAIQVVLSTNAIFSTDVHVSLPIRIINFISIDPPPISPASLGATKSVVEDEYDQRCEYFEPESEDEQYDGYEELGNLPILDDDDEVVQHAVSSLMNGTAHHKDPSRGSEMYYAALQEDLDPNKIESDSCPTGLFKEETEPVEIGARKLAQLSTEPSALRSTGVGPGAASLQQSPNMREEVVFTHGRQIDPTATHVGGPKTASSTQNHGEIVDQFERNRGTRVMGAGSAPASGGSVQDKIRELEERVARASTT